MKKKDFNYKEIHSIIQLALDEDRCGNDLTSQFLINEKAQGSASVVAREGGILCGTEIIKMIFAKLSDKTSVTVLKKDGSEIKKGTKVLRLEGPAQALLTGERVALNFLGRLSGIATLTQHYVKAAANAKVSILDTRKTTPGLRRLEKWAVACGGGCNHRMNLSDMIMIKDNHRGMLLGDRDLGETIVELHKKTHVPVVVEVDTLTQFRSILAAKPDIILLDNMTTAQVKKAVDIRRAEKSRVLLEASGGITLKNLKAFASTGVNRISIGALTHAATSLNFSMEMHLQ